MSTTSPEMYSAGATRQIDEKPQNNHSSYIALGLRDTSRVRGGGGH